jgi:DNA helicase HerA-like ATPase
MQTERFLIAGVSGSGKSIFTRALIAEASRLNKYDQLIIVNRKSELSDLVSPEARFAIDESISASKLSSILNGHKKVFFRVDGYDPREFLNALGTEIMKRSNILLVIEEASEFVPRGKAPKALFRILTAGRDKGHSVIAVTQMLQSEMAGVDLAFIQQSTKLVCFKLIGENDVSRVTALFPELGDQISFLKSHDHLPPEFAVKDMLTSRCGIMRRDPQNPTRRAFVDISRSQLSTGG